VRGVGPRKNVKRFRGGLVFKAHRLLFHSTLGLRVIKRREEDLEVLGMVGAHLGHRPIVDVCKREREFFIDNLLVRIHFIIMMIRWTGRNVQRFQGGLVFKAHRLVYHSILGWRVMKKKKKHRNMPSFDFCRPTRERCMHSTAADNTTSEAVPRRARISGS